MAGLRGIRGVLERDVTVKLMGDISNFEKVFGVAGGILADVTDHFLQLETKAVNVTKRLGMGLQGLALASQGMMAYASNVASGWQDAFALVEKTVEAPVAKLREIDRELRDMALEIPVSAESLAGLASLAGQLGVSTSAIDEFAETAARLGEATDLSAESAIFQLAQFSNIMGTSEDKVENLASALVALGNNTASTEGMILNFSQRIAGVANVVGMTEAQTFGLAAAMASAGVEAERGGTAVSKVLIAINTAAVAGGRELDIFTRVLGMTKEEFRTLQAENPAEVFALFVEALRDAGDEGVRVLKSLQLSDQRLVQSFLALAQSSQDVRTTMKLSNEAFKDGNALAEESDKRFATLSNSFRVFRQNVREVWRSLGDFLIPAMTKVTDLMTAAVRPISGFMNWLSNLNGTLTGLIGVAMGTGSALMFLMGTVARLAPLLRFVGAVGGVVGLVTAGIERLTGKNFEDEVTEIGRFRKALKELGEVQWVASFLNNLKIAWSQFMEVLKNDVIVAAFTSFKEGLKSIIAGNMLQGVKLGFEGLGLAMDGLRKAFGRLAVFLLTNPVTVTIMAIAGALKLMTWYADRAQAKIDAFSSVSGTLAGSVNSQIKNIQDYTDAYRSLTEAANEASEATVAVANKELMETLKGFDSKATRKDFLVAVAFQMANQGVPHDKILEAINKINEALPSDQQVKLNIDFTDPEQRVDAFTTKLKEMATGVSDISRFGLHDFFNNFEIAGKSLNEMPILEKFFSFDKGKTIGDIAVIGDALQGLERFLFEDEEKVGYLEGIGKEFAVMAGRIVGGGEDAAMAVQELGLQIVALAEHTADLPAHVRGDTIQTILTAMEEELKNANIDVDLAQLIKANPDELAENLARDAGLQEGLRNALMMLGVDEKLLQNADDVAKQWELVIKRIGLSGKFLDPLANKFSGLGEKATRLMQFLGPEFTELEETDPTAASAFLRDRLDALAAQMGHQGAIEVIDEHVASLGGLAEAYKSEIGRIAIGEAKRLREELERIDLERFKRSLNSMPLQESIQAIDNKLQSLRKSAHGAADAIEDLEGHRAQLIEQEFGRLTQLVQQEEAYNDQLAQAAKDHSKRMKELAEDEEEALKNHAKNLNAAMDMTRKIQNRQTSSLQSILFNTRDQNELMARWEQQLNELMRMGMDKDVMAALGLNDPNNWQQVNRLMQDALSNPAAIEQINRMWRERLDISAAFVEDSPETDELRDDYAERAADMEEAYAEQVAKIREAISKLGEDISKNLAEAVEEGKKSASPHVRELAKMLEQYLPGEAEDGSRKIITAYDKMSEEVKKAFKGIGEYGMQAAEDILTGFTNTADSLTAIFTPGGSSSTGSTGTTLGDIFALPGGGGTTATSDSRASSGGSSVPDAGSMLGGSADATERIAGSSGRNFTAHELAHIGIDKFGGTITSGYRTRKQQENAYRNTWADNGDGTFHPSIYNSHHLSTVDPAQDVGGTKAQMQNIYNYLRDNYSSSIRQMIFGSKQVKDGKETGWARADHWDHVHIAHGGGMVNREWPGAPGLKADERPAILQVGERVIPKGHLPRDFMRGSGGGGGSQTIIHHNEFKVDKVVASDPNKMAKQLQAKQRLAALRTMGTQRSGANA